MSWYIPNGNPEINNTKIESRAIKAKIKNDKLHFIKARALKDLCIKPEKDEQYHIITEKQFNAYAFILYILESEIIEELYLAIYRINEPTVQSLIDIIEGQKINKATFIISNYFNQTKKPEKWAIKLRQYCESRDNTYHAYTHNHSKVVCIKTATEKYVFEGSGNMSDNARIEQYLFINSSEIFDFHKNWMQSIIEQK